MASTLPLLLLVLCSLTATEARLTVFNLQASNLGASGLSDPDAYVEGYCNSVYLGKTAVAKNNRNPWWSKEFAYDRARVNDVLRLIVYDKDLNRDDELGSCQIRLRVGGQRRSCSLSKGGILSYEYKLG